MKHWTPADRKVPKRRVRWLWFKVRNFVSGFFYRHASNVAMRMEISRRRRASAKSDPVWRESWWLLERRYSKLAKRHSKLELKYLLCKRKLGKPKEEE